MPTLAELLEIERLGAELRRSSFSIGPADADRRLRSVIDLQLRYMPPEHPEVVAYERLRDAEEKARNAGRGIWRE